MMERVLKYRHPRQLASRDGHRIQRAPHDEHRRRQRPRKYSARRDQATSRASLPAQDLGRRSARAFAPPCRLAAPIHGNGRTVRALMQGLKNWPLGERRRSKSCATASSHHSAEPNGTNASSPGHANPSATRPLQPEHASPGRLRKIQPLRLDSPRKTPSRLKSNAHMQPPISMEPQVVGISRAPAQYFFRRPRSPLPKPDARADGALESEFGRQRGAVRRPQRGLRVRDVFDLSSVLMGPWPRAGRTG